MRWPFIKWTLIVVLLGGELAVFFPALARFYVQKRFLPALARRLDREVRADFFSPGLRQVTMKNVTVRGPRDGAEPLAVIPQLRVRLNLLPLLRGMIEAEEVEELAAGRNVGRIHALKLQAQHHDDIGAFDALPHVSEDFAAETFG